MEGNEPTQAIEWFEKAIERRETNLISKIRYSPMLGSLRPDPRYQELLRKMNLPDEPAQVLGSSQ